MNNLQKKYKAEVKNLIEKISERYKPERIIAFGSTAKGDVSEDSDIDLLVVKETDKPFWERVKEVLKLYDGYRSLDVSVLTPKEIEQSDKKGWYFITEEILKQGKTLYERS